MRNWHGNLSPFGSWHTGRRVFNPLSLFANGEPGVWFDHTDSANLDWRRNLLTFTEQFDNAAWVKQTAGAGSAPVVTANAALAPDGTMTADRVVFTLPSGAVVGDISQLIQNFNFTATTHTGSIYIKSNTGLPQNIVVLLQNSQVATVTATTEWQRVSGSRLTSAVSSNFGLRARGTFTADTVDLLVWGAQLELGSTATEYQRITDVSTELRERFPKTTTFTDTAGTTPATVGSAVALMLDKSKGLVDPVVNGTFATNVDSWIASTANVSAAWSSGRIEVTNNGAGWVYQEVPTVIGQTYTFFANFVTKAGGGRVFVGSSIGNFSIGGAFNAGAFSLSFTASSSSIFISLGDSSAGTGVVNVYDDIKLIPGFHATQAVLSARPILGRVPASGRRSLLTRTEEFENPVWGNVAGVVNVTPNTTIAPDGTLTADKLVPAAATNWQVKRQGVTVAAGAYTFSVYAKEGEPGVRLELFVSGVGGSRGAVFNLNTGAVVAASASVQTSVSSLDVYGFRRYSLTLTAGSGAAGFDVRVTEASTVDTHMTGDGVKGIFVWGSQLDPGNVATPYQRVGSTFDVTEAGKADLYHLVFDGTDDWLVTPTITPGTDKAQIFAGVRKLSDAAAGMLVEHSANYNTNAGSFFLTAPNSTGAAGNYAAASRGSAGLNAGHVASSATLLAPISNVVTATHDIAGNLSAIRANGAASGTNGTASKGTGNFLAYPLYIGRRAGTSLPFNGHLYSLVVRFGANLDAGTISATERYVGGKTGVVLP